MIHEEPITMTFDKKVDIEEQEERRLKMEYYIGKNAPVGFFCTFYKELLLPIAFRRLRNLEDSKDVLQDVALKLCEVAIIERSQKLPLNIKAKFTLIKLTQSRAIDVFRKYSSRIKGKENTGMREKPTDFSDGKNYLYLKGEDWLEKQLEDENSRFLIKELRKELSTKALEFFDVFLKDPKSMDLIKIHYQISEKDAKAMKQRYKRNFRILLKRIMVNHNH